MNLQEFCETFRISLSKARKMEKANVLRLDENTDARALAMIPILRNADPLNALQLCQLIEEPSLLLDLGRYAGKAREQLEELWADPQSQLAPAALAAEIGDAAKGDPAAVSRLVDWLRDILPAAPVPYSWIAVRILLAIPANVRQFDGPRVIRALAKARREPGFAGWHSSTSAYGRNTNFYHRPATNSFDL